MKNLKRKIKHFIHWHIAGKPVSARNINKLKTSFRGYFEGYFGTDVPECPHRLTDFGITNLMFRDRKTFVEIEVTLERPGLLIGKGGTVIDGLQAYLTLFHNKTVKIHIVESKLWRHTKKNSWDIF